MMSTFLSALIVFTTFQAFSEACGSGPIQDGVNFNKISGNWRQLYFNKDSEFADDACRETAIYRPNDRKMEYNIVDRYVKVLGARRIQFHTEVDRVDLSTEPNIRNRVLTDYDNYLIFYGCRNGVAAVKDIKLRRGVSYLSPEKVEEVSGVLKKLGIDFVQFEKRRNINCPTFRNTFKQSPK